MKVKTNTSHSKIQACRPPSHSQTTIRSGRAGLMLSFDSVNRTRILTWLQAGLMDKTANFVCFLCLSVYKETPPNIEVCAESLGAKFEY